MLVKIKRSIIIKAGFEQTFNFISDLSNDSLWRKEINRTIVTGNLAHEYSRLSSRRPDNLLILECICKEPNDTVVFQSVKESSFYLKSTREVKYISANETLFIYQLEFDTSIVKYATGFRVPIFIIRMKARADMKKYMQQLSSVLVNH